MTLSRRRVMQLGQALLSGAMVSNKGFAAERAASATADSSRLTGLSRTDFNALVNSSFGVHLDSGSTAWFTLLSVKDMSPKPPSYLPPMIVPSHVKLVAPPQLDTFALQFSFSGDPLPQGTYVFEHPSIGKLPLFIVPSKTSTYTAIVSRFANPAVQSAA